MRNTEAYRDKIEIYIYLYVHYTPSQGSANRSASEGVLGAMPRPARSVRYLTPPQFTTPPILTATLRTQALGKVQLSGRSCVAPPRSPKRRRCWPHACWQSCTTPGRLGVLSNNANPIDDNGAPRQHARF